MGIDGKCRNEQGVGQPVDLAEHQVERSTKGRCAGHRMVAATQRTVLRLTGWRTRLRCKMGKGGIQMIQPSIVAVVSRQKRNGASVTSPQHAVPTYRMDEATRNNASDCQRCGKCIYLRSGSWPKLQLKVKIHADHRRQVPWTTQQQGQTGEPSDPLRWRKERTSKRTLLKTEQPHRRAAQGAMSIVLDVSNKAPGGADGPLARSQHVRPQHSPTHRVMSTTAAAARR